MRILGGGGVGKIGEVGRQPETELHLGICLAKDPVCGLHKQQGGGEVLQKLLGHLRHLRRSLLGCPRLPLRRAAADAGEDLVQHAAGDRETLGWGRGLKVIRLGVKGGQLLAPDGMPALHGLQAGLQQGTELPLRHLPRIRPAGRAHGLADLLDPVLDVSHQLCLGLLRGPESPLLRRPQFGECSAYRLSAADRALSRAHPRQVGLDPPVLPPELLEPLLKPARPLHFPRPQVLLELHDLLALPS
mmetsp:Transcript_2954/g.10229  ORF Transcript_2954/g.10229 Transcript_2954/m.10229 type:complete len:245 (+) Transcript_2954:1018-1752(+)